MHLWLRFFQSSKHLLNSIFGIAFKTFFDLTCIFSIVSKRCPRSGLLSLGNSQKSHGTKSGEYGGCGTICAEFLAKWSPRASAVWDGALSWCKNHELSAQNIFGNGVEWSSWNANSVSKVSNFYDMVKSPKAFCNILNVSASEISFRKQNLMALLCSTNSDIVKIEKITFSRLENTSVTM